jgi:hypothetical protein
MARIFKIKEIEARKRALADESDLYRQTLALEIHNLRLHALAMKRRATWLTLSPLWPLIPSLFKTFYRKKQKRESSKWRLLPTVLAGWQLYQKIARFLPALFSRSRRARLRDDEQAPAPRI